MEETFMITISQILNITNDCLVGKRVKLVRHIDKRAEYEHMFKTRQGILDYQSLQTKEVFKECDYIVSFTGIERKRCILFGVFKVLGSNPCDQYMNYQLEQVHDFDHLIDRVVIDWGPSTINWHQWLDRQDKEIVEIYPEGFVKPFLGINEFVLSFYELSKLINNPNGNHDWYYNLSNVNGIYLILDDLKGEQYIGSAYGKNGIWGRWAEYSKTKHGGNKLLKELIEVEPERYKHFKFSVLKTLSSNLTNSEVIAFETLYKEKLGSRAHGLNKN